MSAIKDAIAVMKEVILLTEKVDRAGGMLVDVSKELRDHDKRLVRLETIVEIAKVQGQKQLPDESN